MKQLIHGLYSCTILCSLFLMAPLMGAAQKKIIVDFNEDGKMIGNYPSRIKLTNCSKDCDQLIVRVHVPLDYYKDEKKKLDSTLAVLYRTLLDTNAILYRLLNCAYKQNKDDRFNPTHIINHYFSPDQKEPLIYRSLKRADSFEKDSIMPSALFNYNEFLGHLYDLNDSIKTRYKENKSNDTSSIRKLIESIGLSRAFAPYRLRIKGQELDTSCMHWTPVKSPDADPCHCFKPEKNYVALEFHVPASAIKEDLNADSFQLVRYSYMKDVGIQWYNKLLEKHKKNIPKLIELQGFIKKQEGHIDTILQNLKVLDLLNDECFVSESSDKKKIADSIICAQKEILEKELRAYDCKDYCQSENILFYCPALVEWIQRLMWLNGDLIRLNPFQVTNQSINLSEKAESPASSPESDATVIQNKMEDEQTRISLWNAAIRHLQDSALTSSNFQFDTIKKLIDSLIAKRNEARTQIDAFNSILKKQSAQAESIKTTKETRKKELSDFLVNRKVFYQGWLMPYKKQLKQTKERVDRIWLRHYNYSGVGLLEAKGKPHFTYPEDENLTLLVHNIKAGSLVKVTETISPATDTAAWTLFASSTIGDIADMYSSLATPAGLFKKLASSLSGYSVAINPEKDTQIVVAATLETLLESTKQLYNKKKNYPELQSFYRNDLLIIKVESDSQSFKIHSTPIEGNKMNLTPTGKCNYVQKVCIANYLNALKSFASSPALIDNPLTQTEDSVPAYFSYRHTLADSQATYINRYSIRVAESNQADSLNQVAMGSSYIKVGASHYLQLAAGIAYTSSAGFITTVDTSGGNFNISRDNDKVRLIAGIRIYPFGLFNLKNPVSVFRDLRWKRRLSLLVATGIPKPLQNIYLGIGFDPTPDLTFTVGAHVQQTNSYLISGNAVKDKQTGYKPHFFMAVTMNPQIVIKAITSFIK